MSDERAAAERLRTVLAGDDPREWIDLDDVRRLLAENERLKDVERNGQRHVSDCHEQINAIRQQLAESQQQVERLEAERQHQKSVRREEIERLVVGTDGSKKSSSVVSSLGGMTRDYVDELEGRLAEIDAGAQADEDDLNKMRDGTKLTRAGVVRIIVYQQQNIRALEQQVETLRALLRELHAMVWGECPSLLDGDSGGSAHLDVQIEAALESR